MSARATLAVTLVYHPRGHPGTSIGIISNHSKALAAALYQVLHISVPLCYNPTGIIMRDNRWDAKMKKNEPPSVWGSLGLAGALGLTIALPLALGSILGNYLDGLTHTNEIYLLLGLLLGLIVGIFGAYRLLLPFFRR